MIAYSFKFLFCKLKNKFLKIRCREIRVFCFHQVSDDYDSISMMQCDWMSTETFKQKVKLLQKSRHHFISLTEAKQKLIHDRFRIRKYAVLTADDGYLSLQNILPWLIQNNIPITLFINAKFLDGISKRYDEGKSYRYLPLEYLLTLPKKLVDIQSHGWEHLDATKLPIESFADQIALTKSFLESNFLTSHLTFHAYTWGAHSAKTDAALTSIGITPVLIDGMRNYYFRQFIHRELF